MSQQDRFEGGRILTPEEVARIEARKQAAVRVLKQWMHSLIVNHMDQKGWSYWNMLTGGDIAFQDMLAPVLAALSEDDQAYFAEMAKGVYFEDMIDLFGESFTSTTFTVVDTQQEQVTWGTVFVLARQEKRLTLALSAPVTPTQIEEIANLVTIGLILGFVVRGEIDLGERVINNLELSTPA